MIIIILYLFLISSLIILNYISDVKIKKIVGVKEKIKIYSGYVKLETIEKYVDEKMYKKLVNGEKTELLLDNEMIWINMYVFANEKMIRKNLLKHILKEDYAYQNDYIYTKEEIKEINRISTSFSNIFKIIFVSIVFVFVGYLFAIFGL